MDGGFPLPRFGRSGLARIGEAAVPSLIQALARPSPEVRAKAAQVLGKIGPIAELRPALEPLLEDRDDGVRDAAKQSLGLSG